MALLIQAAAAVALATTQARLAPAAPASSSSAIPSNLISMTLPILRIRDNGPQWPYSVAQFRADEPRLSISDNPHDDELASYATLDPPIIVCRPEPTTPPGHDPATHRAVEVMPVQGEDGIWRQAWELEALPLPPTPEPEPDWQQFRQALRDENGYAPAFQAALTADPMAGIQLAIGLNEFRRSGDFSDFLEALTSALAALPADQAGHLGLDLLALASRCNLPAAFLGALQALPPEPAP